MPGDANNQNVSKVKEYSLADLDRLGIPRETLIISDGSERRFGKPPGKGTRPSKTGPTTSNPESSNT